MKEGNVANPICAAKLTVDAHYRNSLCLGDLFTALVERRRELPINGKGWELHVTRFEVHTKGNRKRTFGRYQVYIKGIVQPGLTGFTCEARGPGDNGPSGKNKRRVEAGRYQVSTQFGRYRSIGYSTDEHTPAAPHMPGFRLENRGVRTDILVHPGHPPGLYLSSIGCLNLTERIEPNEDMNYWDSRRRVVALLDSLASFAPEAFEHEVITEIPNAFVVIDGEPRDGIQPAPMAAKVLPMAAVAAMAAPTTLPISESAARKCATWLWRNFRADLTAAVQGKPYGVEHLAAIVCQETAIKWVPWIGTQSVATIVERAVYDASGDVPGTSRDAFPADTRQFRERYGPTFTNLLIAEANATRAIQGWGPKRWVYKGYGLFQYDLQHVQTDRAFFEQKQWYDFKTCVGRCTRVLDQKLVAAGGDLWKAIRAYNGSGVRAQRYMENVRYFTPICAETIERERAPVSRLSRGRQPAPRRRAIAVPVSSAAPARMSSGPEWVSRFPDRGDIADLEPIFRRQCEAFIAALRAAGATVDIHSTRRPRERAYLMNGAWRIAREDASPGSIAP